MDVLGLIFVCTPYAPYTTLPGVGCFPPDSMTEATTGMGLSFLRNEIRTLGEGIWGSLREVSCALERGSIRGILRSGRTRDIDLELPSCSTCVLSCRAFVIVLTWSISFRELPVLLRPQSAPTTHERICYMPAALKLALR